MVSTGKTFCDDTLLFSKVFDIDKSLNQESAASNLRAKSGL